MSMIQGKTGCFLEIMAPVKWNSKNVPFQFCMGPLTQSKDPDMKSILLLKPHRTFLGVGVEQLCLLLGRKFGMQQSLCHKTKQKKEEEGDFSRAQIKVGCLTWVMLYKSLPGCYSVLLLTPL